MSGATPTLPITHQPSDSPARAWLFRLIALLGVPAVLIVMLEGSLRFAGFGRSPHFLIPDAKRGYYRTNPDYLRLFMPASFDLRPLNFRVAKEKLPGTVRVVVLGESAAQGIPEPAFGFAPQLRALLRARYPGKPIEVINTGVVAINSHVVDQIARDLAGFSPDVFVVYMGNNEVVGPYGPGCAYLSKMPPLWLIRLSVWIRGTRTGQLLAATIDRVTHRNQKPQDWGGMSMFVSNAVSGDDPRLDAVYHNFEANLSDIVHVAARGHAQAIVCTTVSNLKDCPPFLSLHRPGMSEADLGKWRTSFAQGRLEWLLDETEPARRDLEEALQIDPQYADTAFMLGLLELRNGDLTGGRRLLLDAQHWDALRFRPDPRLNEIVRRVAQANPETATLVDAAKTMASDPTSTGIPAGREILFEHVHFDWPGNYRLARLLAGAVADSLKLGHGSSPDWLDSEPCAAALGYTPHERYSVLLKNSYVVESPPFTNQLTYPEDQAKLVRELENARVESTHPEVLNRAASIVRTAIAADPDNPALAKVAEELADDRGNLNEALAEIRRARGLQPESFALFADEAIKLGRLGRFAEAEPILLHTYAAASPRDRTLMAPALADFYVRTHRLEEGRRLFDEAIARQPHNARLRMLRARLAQDSNDVAVSERDFRAVLADDAGNQEALEALIGLLSSVGRSADAEAACLAAVDRQPGNHANDLRAALLAEARHDDAKAIHCLLAAERSGLVTSAVEIRLARKLLNTGDRDGSLLHLAVAKRLSIVEGEAATTARIADVIAQIRAQP